MPYLISFLAILSIRWRWHQLSAGKKSEKPLTGFFSGAGLVKRAVLLTAAFLPIHLTFGLMPIDPVYSFLTCIAGVVISDRLYWIVGDKFHGKWSRLEFLRMGTGVVIITSTIVFLANLWFYSSLPW